MAIPCFLKFSGIDYDHDVDAQAKLDAFIHWVQTVLAHYEGYLMQLTMGNKGVACVKSQICYLLPTCRV